MNYEEADVRSIRGIGGAIAAVDERSASEKADSLANTLESAAQRLDDLKARLGAKSPPVATGGFGKGADMPVPRRLLPNALDSASRSAAQIHDAIEFIERAL